MKAKIRSARPRRASHFIILLATLALLACARSAGEPPVPPSAAPEAAPTPGPSAPEAPVAQDELDAALRQRLAAALAEKGPTYVARTRHKDAAGKPRYTNRLILETSPYLLQHAHNPVQWFAWGPEAFERARALARPVFLSVGYSTCHWCHVMEEESFEDEEIAAYLNAHYVAIKVDREERPDVDAVHMAFVQQQTGRGGWPMSVWLTPEREPYFSGTYFPPRDGSRGSRDGFLTVLRREAERYAADPKGVSSAARVLIDRLQRLTAPVPPGELAGRAQLAHAATLAEAMFDPINGGRRGAPKFPSSFPLRVLLRQSLRTDTARPRELALHTLDHMAQGGIRDQLGGGFHRYATRADWDVPHFEKMLYDNALLAVTYLEAGALTGQSRYLDVARETLYDVLATFGLPDGTLASATDADSFGSPAMGLMPAFGTPDRREEGLYFTWTPAELEAALGPADARIAAAWYGVGPRGPVEGRSGLSAKTTIEAVAAALGLSASAVGAALPRIREALLAVRVKRPAPLRDDKALLAWNGLAISALARGAIVLADARLGAAAEAAALAFAADLRAGKPLSHYLHAGARQGEAFLDDLALLALSFLDVFELTAEPAWLRDAIAIADDVHERFADAINGGYFQTHASAEALLYREKTADDGPTPSGDSAMAQLLSRLAALTLEPRFSERAELTMRAHAAMLERAPLALEQMLVAVDMQAYPSVEIVIALPEGAGRGALAAAARPLLDGLREHLAPGAALIVAPASELTDRLRTLVPWVSDKTAPRGVPTAYVCEQRVCQLPSTDKAGLLRALRAIYRAAK